jgi:hypothetical protein
MADPLTALSLASNILQLISFASDLISKGHEIYKSVDGKLVEHLELEAVTRSLRDLSRSLIESKLGDSTKKLSHTDEQLLVLSRHCNVLAGELIDAIQRLKVGEKKTAWNSFRQALRSVWNEEKIERLSDRLENYRRQIDTTLLISLREQVSNSDSRRENHSSRHDRNSSEPIRRWQADLMSAVKHHDWESQSQVDMATFSSKVSFTTKAQREDFMKAQILERLSFREKQDRFERVEEAHARTFDWIFCEGDQLRICQPATPSNSQVSSPNVSIKVERDDSNKELKIEENKPHWDNFARWLRGSESLYWITGKPGSGKSTLMKYLYNKQQTFQHLQKWKDGLALVTASFFFWNSGTTMQTSKTGLLQALIYDSIGSRSHLIPRMFPERWRSYELFGNDLHPWTWAELDHGLSIATQDETLKFYFAIDGLDELHGDCDELATFILEYSRKTNVKLCVASRPWLVFEDAFQRRPSLRLETLTRGDIHYYVSSKLGGNIMFQNLARLRPLEAEQLIKEVTAKAAGVFLWVCLVVMSLLEGLRDGDSISDLQERLSLLPSDLEELFSKILNNLSPRYFDQASKLFQLVGSALEDEPLTLLSLAFADDGWRQALSTQTKSLSTEEIDFKIEMMRRRLNSRCKGLLEAPSYDGNLSRAKVQYLHRTVRDYLHRPDMWDYLRSRVSASYDPDLMLCGAYLQMLKTVNMSDVTPTNNRPAISLMLERINDLVRVYIKYSLKIETQSREMHILALAELDKACTELFSSKVPGNQGKSWLETFWEGQRMFSEGDKIEIRHWTAFVSRNRGNAFFEHSFFEFAFDCQLHCFVDEQLKSGFKPALQPGGLSLLDRARQKNDLTMLAILSVNGIKPSLKISPPNSAGDALLPGCSSTIKSRRKSWLGNLVHKLGDINAKR